MSLMSAGKRLTVVLWKYVFCRVAEFLHFICCFVRGTWYLCFLLSLLFSVGDTWCRMEVKKLPKKNEIAQDPRCQNGDTNHFPYWGGASIWRHRLKFNDPVTWRPLFEHPWSNSDTVAHKIMDNRSSVIFPFVFNILFIIQMHCVLNFQILGNSVLQYAVRLVLPTHFPSL